MAVDAARLTHSLFATDHSTLIAGSGFKGRTDLACAAHRLAVSATGPLVGGIELKGNYAGFGRA